MPALAVAPIELERADGEAVLDDVIVRTWELLSASRSAVCPLCAGELDPEYGAHARPVAGRCNNCGTTLS